MCVYIYIYMWRFLEIGFTPKQMVYTRNLGIRTWGSQSKSLALAMAALDNLSSLRDGDFKI